MNTETETVELDDKAWAEMREAVTQRFLHISAEEFGLRYQAGEYDQIEPDFLMDVLAYLPELDEIQRGESVEECQ